jgi:hypothetical protein
VAKAIITAAIVAIAPITIIEILAAAAADVGGHRVDGRIEVVVVELAQRGQVAGAQDRLQAVDRRIGRRQARLHLGNQGQLIAAHLGLAVGVPVGRDLGARFLHPGERFGRGDRPAAGLVGGVDDIDRIEVANRLQLMHRLHAVADHRFHLCLADRGRDQAAGADRQHADAERRERPDQPGFDCQIHLWQPFSG